jgi:hypothetical protein
MLTAATRLATTTATKTATRTSLPTQLVRVSGRAYQNLKDPTLVNNGVKQVDPLAVAVVAAFAATAFGIKSYDPNEATTPSVRPPSLPV